jgi:protein-S-isoprenylcysteine O-methyltransferase Ste14
MVVGVTAALLFGAAGRLDWNAGWLVVVLSLVGLLLEETWLPDALKAERSRTREGSKGWDVVLTRIVMIGLLVATVVIAGLEARWSPARAWPSWWLAPALVVWTLGYALAIGAMRANPFFSRTVRIQEEHRVVRSGPYRWLRHPGYAASLLFTLATPALLDSAWAYVPAAASALAILVRTGLEDATLRRELAGYGRYASEVRFRLVPGVW